MSNNRLKDAVQQTLESFSENIAKTISATHLSGLRVVYFSDEPAESKESIKASADIDEANPAEAEITTIAEAIGE